MGEERVYIAGGVRTPFVRACAEFSTLRFQELGTHVVKALIERERVRAEEVDEVVFGAVLLDPRTPNWAREIVFAAGLPKSVYAYAVSNNCISSMVAITAAAQPISAGRAGISIAGGAESMSTPAVLFRRQSAARFIKLSRAKSLGERLSTIARFRPRDLLPEPAVFTEPSTGLSMGQHMEITAQALGIEREAQDRIAFASHRNAAQAAADGRLGAEIAELNGVTRDTIIRPDTSPEKLATLKPVFDRSGKGTLTAGNSSALTDGAAAVLLMSGSKLRETGREGLAYIRDAEYSALDPAKGLLMAPALAVPRLLRRNNLSFTDFDLIEIHEAFGAQVEANIRAWETGLLEEATDAVPRERINQLGGSIALGHPFAATGARMVTTMANELKRRNAKRGLISICAAGGMAGAMVLERDV